MTTTGAPGSGKSKPPSTWAKEGGKVYCLGCRREIAAERGMDEAPEKASAQDRARLRSAALAEFEIRRDPDRPDAEIARAIRSSVAAVGKVRERLQSEAG